MTDTVAFIIKVAHVGNGTVIVEVADPLFPTDGQRELGALDLVHAAHDIMNALGVVPAKPEGVETVAAAVLEAFHKHVAEVVHRVIGSVTAVEGLMLLGKIAAQIHFQQFDFFVQVSGIVASAVSRMQTVLTEIVVGRVAARIKIGRSILFKAAAGVENMRQELVQTDIAVGVFGINPNQSFALEGIFGRFGKRGDEFDFRFGVGFGLC